MLSYDHSACKKITVTISKAKIPGFTGEVVNFILCPLLHAPSLIWVTKV